MRSMLQDTLTFFGPTLFFILDAVAIALFVTVVIAVAAVVGWDACIVAITKLREQVVIMKLGERVAITKLGERVAIAKLGGWVAGNTKLKWCSLVYLLP